jgi:hypothetical protein
VALDRRDGAVDVGDGLALGGLADEPPEASAEVIRINTEARHLALQVALLIPILAAVLGVLNGFRMRRLPDPKPNEAVEGMLGG